jgi:hypothetical protein
LAGGEAVGLFSYLYHEYVPAIGAALVQGQGQQPVAGLRQYVLANCLVRGLIPGPFIQDVPIEPKNAWQQTVSDAFFAYCKPYKRFPEYLILGVTRRPPEVACDTVTYPYQPSDSQTIVPEKALGGKSLITLRAVVLGTFEAADGSLGTIVVNATDKPQKATLKLPNAFKPPRFTSMTAVRTGNIAPLPQAPRLNCHSSRSEPGC